MTSAALLGYSYICTRPRRRSWPDSSLAWRSRARGYCTLTLALVGTGLAIGPLGGGGSWVGIGLGLLSALIYSFYILAATRVTRDVDALSCGCRGSRRPTGLARSDRAGVCCSAGPSQRELSARLPGSGWATIGARGSRRLARGGPACLVPHAPGPGEGGRRGELRTAGRRTARTGR